MVLPLIAAGVGVVSAVASLKAQSDATAANNRAIAGQIYAEQRSEEIRKATAEFQKRQIDEQARMESAQRRAAFREQDNALILASIQANAEMQIAAANADAQSEVNRRALRDLATQLNAESVNVKANSRKGKSDATRQLASRQGADTSNIVNNADEARATLASQQLSGGTTSSNIVEDESMSDESMQALQASLRSESLANDELEAIDNYEVANAFNQSLERASQLGNATFVNADADRRIKDALNINKALTDVNQRAIVNQRQQVRLDRNIIRENAALDKKLRKFELTANSNLAASKSALSQSQLYSQRSLGVNFGTAAASIAQNALPLVSAIVPRAQIRQPQQSEFGGVQLGYELSARALAGNYNYEGVNAANTSLSRMALPARVQYSPYR
jgi:hypothetical protein